MSGIFGFATDRGVSQCARILDDIFKSMKPPLPTVHYRWTADNHQAGLGVVHPEHIGHPAHWATDGDRGIICVFDGVVHTDVRGNDIDTSKVSGAAMLLDGYLQSGTECLETIRGSFNVAWWDRRYNRLVLGNDKIGRRLLFYTVCKGRLVFSSLLAGVMAADLLSPEIDVEGFADLLYFGEILGERTLFKNVKVLPPATILVFEAAKAKIHRYWHVDHIEPHGIYTKNRADDLEVLFKRSIRQCVPAHLQCSIALTGGLDSRCILAGVASQNLSCVAHTGGQQNSTDVRLARQAAAKVNIRHALEPLTPENLDKWLVIMVYLQGGIAATLHSHPCRDIWNPRAYDVAITGIAGEIASAGWFFDPAFFDIHDSEKSRRTLQRFQLLSKAATTQCLERIWQLDYRHIGMRQPDEHMKVIMDDFVPRDPPVLMWEYFLMQEEIRKRLNKASLIVRASREVFTPYIDHALVEAILSIPLRQRIRPESRRDCVTSRIQVDLIKRLSPKLLDVPWEMTLIPLSAPQWKVRIINSIRRRLTGPPRKEPNSYYALWSRNQMRPFLMELLYDPNAAFRAYLCWEEVEKLLNAHFSGRENWLDFIGALTVLEIAHRLWIEPKPFPLNATLDIGYTPA